MSRLSLICRAAIALMAFSGLSCSNFTLYDLFRNKTQPPVLALNPSEVSVYINGTMSFVATGGSPNYVYYFKNGTGSGAINSVTGLYTAPAFAATDLIEVADAAGARAGASITILISPTLQIWPIAATLIAAGTRQFSHTGGFPPYTFAVRSGVGSIDAISGFYSAGGITGGATIRVVDAVGAVSDAAVSVVASGALAISPGGPLLEEGSILVFSALGGVAPYGPFSLGVTPQGSLLADGTYTAPHVVGANLDTIRVTDSNTPTPSTATTTVSVLPARPLSLVADGSAGGPHDIGLSWTNQASSLDGFRIDRKLGSGGTYAMVALVAADVTTYLDSGLLLNKTYVYRVVAYKGTLESPPSNEAFSTSN